MSVQIMSGKVAYYSRKTVVEKHDDFDLPKLSISMLRRLEQRRVYRSARFSGPNSPAHLSDDDIRAIRDYIRGCSLDT
jgi:hypothetical protein